ncbi:MAG TPA: apolipoprotein N-acyltransferase, partial [Corynebacterium sp.]|nr:apolipoprotein N-acyltransferase [Corynebacterium sp.]
MLLFLRLLLAGLSGAGVYFSYQPHGYWLLGIFGIAGLFLSLSPWRGNILSAKAGALIGFIHALVSFLLLLPWIGELVGAMPYIALSVFLSLYALLLGVFGVFIARLRLGFLIFPSFYLAIELLRSSVPFGGFSWVRLGWGQVDGPLAFLAAWGGPALVTAAAATIGTSIAASLFDPSRRISKQNLKSWT